MLFLCYYYAYFIFSSLLKEHGCSRVRYVELRSKEYEYKWVNNMLDAIFLAFLVFAVYNVPYV